jgi:hypothetical protein
MLKSQSSADDKGGETMDVVVVVVNLKENCMK